MLAIRFSSLEAASKRHQSDSRRVAGHIGELRHVLSKLSALEGMEGVLLALKRSIAELEREAALLNDFALALERALDCYAAHEYCVINDKKLWRANPFNPKWKRNDLAGVGLAMGHVKLI